MNSPESKYSKVVMSKKYGAEDIYSKTLFDIESKTTSDIISIAKNYKGANEIEALVGSFSACKIDDWKIEKENYLKSTM